MGLFRRLGSPRPEMVAPRPSLEPPVVPESMPQPNPDHAWKQLSLVNEWIRHSDAKAGATLAVTGVLATMTFNLSNHLAGRTLLTDVLQVAIVLLLILTGFLGGWTLAPRIRDRAANPDVPNRLYFGSIATGFTQATYRAALISLMADPVALVGDLADQIYVNAMIATAKAQRVKWAVRGAFATVPLVAALAVVVGVINP